MVRRLLRAGAFSVVVAAGLASPRPVQADAQADEYRVKAAFLYKFGSYIEWPSGSFASADTIGCSSRSTCLRIAKRFILTGAL